MEVNDVIVQEVLKKVTIAQEVLYMNYLSVRPLVLSNTLSHIWDRLNLPMLLFKEGLLTTEVIHSRYSSWSAPIIVVPKGDGGKHLVIDYRALNKVTRKFTWPMPKVEDIFSKLNGATYFTTLDLCTGYHHIPLDKSSIPKTAFNSPSRKYEYIKVPFGLAQALAYCPRVNDRHTQGFPFCYCLLR